jgi:hypothetical protein
MLAGCSEKDKEPEFTVKDAIEKNHVVIQNHAEKFEDLMQDGTKAENILPMFAFLEDVDANKESKLQVTIFPKKGEPTTSEIHYVSKEKVIFTNKNKTYSMPTGEIECTSVFSGNSSFMLDGCKSEPSTILVIPFSQSEYMKARNEYRKLKKS